MKTTSLIIGRQFTKRNVLSHVIAHKIQSHLHFDKHGKFPVLCDLTAAFVAGLLARQPNCAICNDVMVQCTGKKCGWQWSIDRIDNSQGHIIGNVRLTCFYCNVRQYGIAPSFEEASLMKRTKSCKAGCHIASVSRLDTRLGHIAEKLRRVKVVVTGVPNVLMKAVVEKAEKSIAGIEVINREMNRKKIVRETTVTTIFGTVTTERINDGYSWARYNTGQDVLEIIVRVDGYINATELAKKAQTTGGKVKRIADWLSNAATKEFIKELCIQENRKYDAVVCQVAGGAITCIRGTYLHPFLIPHVAFWMSPKFALCVSRIMNELAMQPANASK